MIGDDGIVHGAVQALIKYPDRVKDCKVYLSRKPCAHCVKMLVQAAVEKVFYLPLRPEKDDTEENKNVDALFKVSTVSSSFFVPNITLDHIKELTAEISKAKNEYGTHLLSQSEDKSLQNLEWNDKWTKKIKEDLSWDEFGDKGIKKQVKRDMKNMLRWFRGATLCTGNKKEMDWESVHSTDRLKQLPQKRANHLSRLAQMLSNRTDDPKRGVGCVIAVDDEIVSIGWNGFPSKALYGNHPRGSKDDKKIIKKYPHVIHAEQNALMCRNRRDLTDSIAFVNLTPCNECMPMLYQCGVKTVVLPVVDETNKREKYFYELLKKGEISVYEQVPKKNRKRKISQKKRNVKRLRQ
jgi:deoxycytidylate deaminase